MKRISSRSTVFYKRIFPLLWFGFLAFFVITALWACRRTHGVAVPFLAMPVLMAVIGYVLFRRLIFDLVDEVWDDGDALIVRNAGTEERVLLENIINIGFSTMTNPERVTVTLRDPVPRAQPDYWRAYRARGSGAQTGPIVPRHGASS